MKPTVSLNSTSLLLGSFTRRVVGSSVANNWSATYTSELVSRVEQRGLAHVGIPYDRNHRQTLALAFASLFKALLAHVFDFGFQMPRCANEFRGGLTRAWRSPGPRSPTPPLPPRPQTRRPSTVQGVTTSASIAASHTGTAQFHLQRTFTRPAHVGRKYRGSMRSGPAP